MKKALVKMLLAVTALATPLLARADLIYYDGFNYANGNITNVSSGLWVNFSGSGNHDMYINNKRLELTTSSSTVVTPRQDDDCRFLSVTNGSIYTNSAQMLYASFTLICTNLPNGGGTYFASFYNPASTGGGYFGRIQAFTNGTVLPNTWRLGVTANGAAANPADGGYPVDLALNTPYQVIEELDPVTLDAATIWINPIDINQTGAAATETHYTSSDSIGLATSIAVTSYSFRQATLSGDNAYMIVTNLALATTFAEAATNIWATNALTPVILYQPASVTNFPGSSFNLSVVANGQGLGELNYQWRESGAGIVNPIGNTNFLPFTSVPSTSGTNTYDVIITTPFGLSVTSSVVTVAIDTTPKAPIFATQPSNTALYQGQNAIFMASVLTPGNPTFTWYSNNVVVTDGVNSSGYSSTLQINSLNAASTGTFKVAVTNDVFATGVVSTNATLSVKVPASVNIGYLHTLVDPTTFQPTNVPPTIAYQVTGIVTTYTNLTTADTSSYYLQDASGGINIFVTGGSTFRPQLGDVITFVGVLSSYTSGLELYADSTATTVYPFTSYTVLSNNIAALPVPRAIGYNFMTNRAYANTNLGGSLVKISDVNFGTNAGTMTSTTANQTLAVTNSAGQIFFLFFPDLDPDVAGQTLPSYAYTVSGVLYSQNSVVTNTIVVTRFADINTTAPVADVGVTTTGLTNVLAGVNLIYTNIVKNLGPVAATNTVVTNTLPFGTAFVSANYGGVNNSGVITWTLGTLASGAISNLTLTVRAPYSGSTTNLAGATSDTPQFNPAANVGAKFITTITPVADVSAAVTGPVYVFAGSNLSYSILISNAGPSQASSVVVTDTLPVNVTFVSATGGGANNSGTVNWSVGALASNATASVTVTVKAPASGSINNKAIVSTGTSDSNLANNTSAQVVTTVAPLPVAGPVAFSGGTATISWNVAAGPTYSILWSTNVAGPYSAIATGLTASPYTDSAHPSQTTGFYKITSP